MKKFFAILVVVLLFFPGVVFAQTEDDYFEASVVNVDDERGSILIVGTNGDYKGLEMEVNTMQLPSNLARIIKNGDKVVALKVEGETSQYVITDFIRQDALGLLFVVFAVIAVLVGKKWGAASILGMAYSFIIIFNVLIPSVVSGNDPVVSAVFASTLIVPVTFYLSHGISRKTHIAIVSTIVSLVVTGVLAALFIEAAHLTGYAQEEALFLGGNNYNMKGILLAGIIIGVLGVLDDITISQASVVEELSDANKKAPSLELYRRAMNVGRDHISSLVNTLVLVYTGASLPLLLLFYESSRGIGDFINIEMVADEIVRTLVGSIGLILAVPLTTFIASFSVKKGKLITS